MRWDLIALAAAVLLTGWFVVVGADTYWAVALGDTVRSSGHVPAGVPFAAAAHPSWPNPLVLGELVLSGANAAGAAGVASLHVLLVAATLGLTVEQARQRGAGPGRVAVILVLVVAGSLFTFGLARLPSLSLVPFTVLILLLRRQHVRPSGGIWWVVALLALWANLHGGVLIGAAVALVQVALSRGRRRPVESVLVGLAILLALCATPALERTPAYYAGVLANEAARQGTELWAQLDVTTVPGALLALAAVGLVILAARSRPPLWELAAIVGLGIGAVATARNGVWLLLFLAPLCAGSHEARPAKARPTWSVLAAAAIMACALVTLRGPAAGPPDLTAARKIRAVAAGRTVLAPEPLAETLAQQGVRVWASNPIDAFPRATQVAYLAFLHHPDRLPADLSRDVLAVLPRGVHPGGWHVLVPVGGWDLLGR